MQLIDRDKLLRKYFTGSLSDLEKKQLQQWIDQSDTNKKVFETLKKVWEEQSMEPEMINSEELIDIIWDKGIEKSNSKQNRPWDWNYITKVAAIFLILFSIIILQFRIINFNDNNIVTENPDRVINRSPAGQKTKTYLPDGSVVWLNGGSQIEHSQHINDSIRLVRLQGEAFFEVAEDTEKPFIVQCGKLETIALGTSFNVNAYQQSNMVNVSLVSGKVKIKNTEGFNMQTILSPGYELVFNKENNEFHEQSFDLQDRIGWKDGILVFKSAGYDEFKDKLENWYGYEIITKGNPPDDFSLTTVYEDETLVNILRNLQFSKEFDYQFENDFLIITFQ